MVYLVRSVYSVYLAYSVDLSAWSIEGNFFELFDHFLYDYLQLSPLLFERNL